MLFFYTRMTLHSLICQVPLADTNKHPSISFRHVSVNHPRLTAQPLNCMSIPRHLPLQEIGTQKPNRSSSSLTIFLTSLFSSSCPTVAVYQMIGTEFPHEGLRELATPAVCLVVLGGVPGILLHWLQHLSPLTPPPPKTRLEPLVMLDFMLRILASAPSHILFQPPVFQRHYIQSILTTHK